MFAGLSKLARYLACASVFLFAAWEGAHAQNQCFEELRQCNAKVESRVQACIARCGGDGRCAAACESARQGRSARCAKTYQRCRGVLAAPIPPNRHGAGSDPLAAPSPAAPQTATREVGEQGVDNVQGRIYFLRRGETETARARFYTYLIVGSGVSAERRAAVAKGVACNLYFVRTQAEIAELSNPSLLMIPARRVPEAEREADARGQVAYTVSPRELLSAYDDRRGGFWLGAVEHALGGRGLFDPSKAVVMIGARRPLAYELDGLALSPLDESSLEPIIADASDLSARHLTHWTAKMVEGVKKGQIRSEQEFQSLMSWHSYIEAIGGGLGFAGLFQVRPAAAAPIADPVCN